MGENASMIEKSKKHDDRRAKRTKSLIFGAFAELVQSQRFDEIRTLEIIDKAGVGKSTFYEHFSDKNDVLCQSLEYPMSVFADALTGNADTERVDHMLGHFWQRRAFARIILSHPTREVVERTLKNLITARLGGEHENGTPDFDAARASFLTSGFLSLLSDWLSGKIATDKSNLRVWLKHFSFPSSM